MRLKILLAWAAATLVLGGGGGDVASAATGSTLSSSTFDADTTAGVTGNFDAVTPLPYCSGDSCFNGFNTLTIGDATFSTPNSDGQVNVNSAYYNGPTDLSSPYLVNSLYSGPAPDVIDISLSSGVTAFGLNFDTLFNSTTATFSSSARRRRPAYALSSAISRARVSPSATPSTCAGRQCRWKVLTIRVVRASYVPLGAQS